MVLVVLAVPLSAYHVSSVRATDVASIGDDYNYTSDDPDCAKWDCTDMFQECDPGATVCHDMRVDNPPGYLNSVNYACKAGWDPSSTHSGCGRDARMHSAQALTYSAGTGQSVVLTERYSPNRRDAGLCGIWYPGNPVLNTAWPPDDYSMHWIGLKYSAQSSPFVYAIVEHACVWDGFTLNWKYSLSAYYTDSNGVQHYESWTDWKIDDNQWLDLTIEVGSNGQDTRLAAKNTSTGLSYFKNIATNLGSTSGSVEIAVQYRHNESSRTDFVDARISDPDFGISANSPLNICPGTMDSSTVTLTSTRGFSGTVSLSSSMDRSSSYVSQYLFYTSLTLSSGGSAATGLFFSAQDNTNAQGTYVVVVTGASGSISHSTAVTVNVSYSNCVGGGGGGGGSVAYGTLITEDDGSKIPVQSIVPGMRVVIYDVPTDRRTVATITLVETVVTDSLLTIHTLDGLPFRADANPRMVLWVLTTDGPFRKSITLIQPGDQIYNFELGRWVAVTRVTVSLGGQHLMYDLATNQTAPGEYIANGYPDCPSRGCKEGPG